VYGPVPASERPARIDEIPLYRDFYDEHQLYRRAHVLVEGITRKAYTDWWWRMNSPEAYVVAETVGADTGSTEYFKVGTHQFETVDANNNDGELLFSWNKKDLLIYKIEGTEAIKLTVKDEDPFNNDDLLMEVTIPINELPQPGDGYVQFIRKSETKPEYSVMTEAEILFKVKVTEGSDRVSTKSDLIDSMIDINGTIDYGENVLELSGGDRALLQSWRHTGGQRVDGAVLWLLGRNDCYMHPHVLKDLFLVNNELDDDEGPRFDVYVLNWRENGLARHRGWVTDAWMTTHNKYGDFDVYLEEVGMSLQLMKELGQYNQTLGYAHSTGVTILLNWIIKNGDDDFNAFLFNGPFLDWGHVGGDLKEFALEHLTNFLVRINIWSNEEVIDGKETPDVYKGDPIEYLGREVVPSAFSGRYFSQYYFEWSMRILYSGTLTAGFARGATNAFGVIEDAAPVTSKPTLVLASLSDDVVDAEEMEELSASMISRDRTFVGLPYSSHDVFLSGDEDDTREAIAVAREWIKGGYYLDEQTQLPGAATRNFSSANRLHNVKRGYAAGFALSIFLLMTFLA